MERHGAWLAAHYWEVLPPLQAFRGAFPCGPLSDSLHIHVYILVAASRLISIAERLLLFLFSKKTKKTKKRFAKLEDLFILILVMFCEETYYLTSGHL